MDDILSGMRVMRKGLFFGAEEADGQAVRASCFKGDYTIARW